MAPMSASTQTTPAAGVAWDLTDLFSSPDDPKIEASWAEAHRAADAFAAKYRGKPAIGALTPAELAAAIAELENLAQQASKPAIYANLVFSANTSDPKNGAFMQAQMEKASEVQVKLMFFDLELQDAPQAWIDGCLADPAMANYVHHLNVVRAFAPHKLSEPEEVLLEQVANTGSRAWVRLHDELTANHAFHLVRPGSDVAEPMTQEQVLDLLHEPDRELRQAAADALSRGLAELQRPVVFTYNTLMADKKLEDGLRKHPYAEHSRHLSNELDKETVNLVMQLCKERGDLVARFYDVKREVLDLPELTHIDRYAPLFESTEQVDWQTAKEMVLEAYGAFSPTMAQCAAEFFDKRWIDAESRKGKTGGAFCASITPDTHPVVLLSYLGKLGDVMTLAHELGHGVHGSLARQQTYFNMHGTLPMAELASIFGEMLVFEKVVSTATPRDQMALYANKVESIFASVYRQAAMFRFEQRCHEMRRSEGELTAEQFGEVWQEEMQSMFGDSVKMGEQHKLWWSYVGHFFYAPFYVYAYSFGELLALAIFQKAKKAGPAFADRYLDVLRQGGSKSPHDLMAMVDVDLRSREFWQGGFDAIEAFVAKFERLWQAEKAD